MSNDEFGGVDEEGGLVNCFGGILVAHDYTH